MCELKEGSHFRFSVPSLLVLGSRFLVCWFSVFFMNILFALLVYPGLLLTLILATVFSMVVERRAKRQGTSRFVFSGQLLLGLMSILLMAFGLALLPWPLHPAADWPWVGRLALLWVVIEGAFLLPLLPGLRSAAPLVVRAASRETQLGVAGRAVVWLAIGLVLAQAGPWSLLDLPGRAGLLLAGLLAVPAAAGVGPFGAERNLHLTGMEQGLDNAAATLLRFARSTRAAGLLAMLIVASLHTIPTQPLFALLLMLALFMVMLLLLRQTAALPRLTLPAALRWCWWRALPLAVIAFVYLGLVGMR